MGHYFTERVSGTEIPGGIPGTDPAAATADHPVPACSARPLQGSGLVPELPQDGICRVVPEGAERAFPDAADPEPI